MAEEPGDRDWEEDLLPYKSFTMHKGNQISPALSLKMAKYLCSSLSIPEGNPRFAKAENGEEFEDRLNVAMMVRNTHPQLLLGVYVDDLIHVFKDWKEHPVGSMKVTYNFREFCKTHYKSVWEYEETEHNHRVLVAGD